jgi:D-aspartate ligase
MEAPQSFTHSAGSLFRNYDFSCPALVLKCLESSYVGLGQARSLGRLGVPVYGVVSSNDTASIFSKFFKNCFFVELNSSFSDETFVELLVNIAQRIGQKSVLIPTLDYVAILIARNYEVLKRDYFLPIVDPTLISNLCDKRQMNFMAQQNGIATPKVVFPKCKDEVVEFARGAVFPLVLKGIEGTALERRTNKRMVIVKSESELISEYDNLEDPDSPNLMIQEYIDGEGFRDWIFNGYFDSKARCLTAFTGKKIRQFPLYTGYACLGECSKNEIVESISINFLEAVGFSGVVDIDYRYDYRDGFYKILDVNPRVGSSFRLFVGQGGLDVVRAMYLDQTSQEVPHDVQTEGRKWIVEDRDCVASLNLYRQGRLSIPEWRRSLRGIKEYSWFAVDDPSPFFVRGWHHLIKKFVAPANKFWGNPKNLIKF